MGSPGLALAPSPTPRASMPQRPQRRRQQKSRPDALLTILGAMQAGIRFGITARAGQGVGRGLAGAKRLSARPFRASCPTVSAVPRQPGRRRVSRSGDSHGGGPPSHGSSGGGGGGDDGDDSSDASGAALPWISNTSLAAIGGAWAVTIAWISGGALFLHADLKERLAALESDLTERISAIDSKLDTLNRLVIQDLQGRCGMPAARPGAGTGPCSA